MQQFLSKANLKDRGEYFGKTGEIVPAHAESTALTVKPMAVPFGAAENNFTADLIIDKSIRLYKLEKLYSTTFKTDIPSHQIPVILNCNTFI